MFITDVIPPPVSSGHLWEQHIEKSGLYLNFGYNSPITLMTITPSLPTNTSLPSLVRISPSVLQRAHATSISCLHPTTHSQTQLNGATWQYKLTPTHLFKNQVCSSKGVPTAAHWLTCQLQLLCPLTPHYLLPITPALCATNTYLKYR